MKTESSKTIVYIAVCILWSLLMIPISNLIGWDGRNSGFAEGSWTPSILAAFFGSFLPHAVYWYLGDRYGRQWPSWIAFRKNLFLWVIPFILTSIFLIARL